MLRTMLLLAFVSAAFTAPLAAADSPADTFTSCIGCHGIPDPGVIGDAHWITAIEQTACVQPVGPKSQAMRRALIEYLKSTAPQRASLVNTARAPEAHEGTVTLPFGDAVALLVPLHDRDGAVRVHWTSKTGGGRAVPAGKYRIQNYRVGLQHTDGKRWEVWAAGARGPVITVKAGESTALKMKPTVALAMNLNGEGRKRRVGLQVIGLPRMGATITCEGHRVPITYHVSAGSRTVGQGKLAYG